MKKTPLLLTLLALGALSLPAAAQAAPSGTMYDVTISGGQSFDQTTTDPESRTRDCFDTRGSISQASIANFKSTTKLRVRIVKRGRTYRLQRVGSQGYSSDWDMDVDMAHKGSTNLEAHPRGDCDTWAPLPPPEVKNCSKLLQNRIGASFGQKIVRGRTMLEVSGGQDIPTPGDPFEGCPYGDHSLALYRAEGTFKPKVILSSVASEVILKGEAKDPGNTYPGDLTSGSKKTTVRVLFKRVKPT